MPISVVMPALGMAQETGKLISWLKREGEPVTKGEPLLEVETDKAVMEVESPEGGVLAGITAQPGDEVQVGRTIAWILKPGEAVPTNGYGHVVPAVAATNLANAIVAARTAESVVAPHSDSARVKISPKARRLAAEHGIDPAQLRGTGPAGEILAADVLAAAEARPATDLAPAAADQSPLAAKNAVLLPRSSPVARLMAERTTQSWTTIPHFFLARELDASALLAARHDLSASVQKSYRVKLSLSDLLIGLIARVLARHPRMNASWLDGKVRPNSDINICLAIAVADGVVAPVITYADKGPLGAIALQRHQLTERARASRLQPSDLAGGTFTLSNLGMFDVDAFTAIITPPQVAILAAGRITDRVVAVAGQPAVRPMITLTLSSDHRVIDGARAAEFMRDLAAAVAEPQKWLLQ
ncbi:MAG: dihydrolipoamide acetyltransferase family protein [Terriglobales bacterium]